MLIIAIGHGTNALTDPFICSCHADNLDPKNMLAVRDHIAQFHSLEHEWIDELLVVENDTVIEHYSEELQPMDDEDEVEVVDSYNVIDHYNEGVEPE